MLGEQLLTYFHFLDSLQVLIRHWDEGKRAEFKS